MSDKSSSAGCHGSLASFGLRINWATHRSDAPGTTGECVAKQSGGLDKANRSDVAGAIAA
jgi:hypothetical protein